METAKFRVDGKFYFDNGECTTVSWWLQEKGEHDRVETVTRIMNRAISKMIESGLPFKVVATSGKGVVIDLRKVSFCIVEIIDLRPDSASERISDCSP